jgi:hypothetical protein
MSANKIFIYAIFKLDGFALLGLCSQNPTNISVVAYAIK